MGQFFLAINYNFILNTKRLNLYKLLQMTTVLIREKLYDFIRVADDKKVKAIYMMLEDEIIEEVEWWKNQQFIQDLNTRFENWKSGKDKGFTVQDIDASIELLKQKRK